MVVFVQLTTECCWGQPSDPCQRGCLASHACLMWGPRTLNADDDIKSCNNNNLSNCRDQQSNMIIKLYRVVNNADSHCMLVCNWCKIRTHTTNDNKSWDLRPTHFNVLLVVKSGNTLHEMRSWMVSKIRADVSNAQTTSTGYQVFGMFVWSFVEDTYLQYIISNYLSAIYHFKFKIKYSHLKE